MNRWLKLVALFGVGLACNGGETRSADPQPEVRSAPSPREIRGWINGLASNRFEVREAATKHLENSGIEAVQPLSEAAQRDNLEVTCRAIRALEAIADRGDLATFEEAQTILERLAASTSRSVARRADVALHSLTAARRRHAMARIAELGGIVKPLSSFRGVIIPDDETTLPLQVILNKRWKGGDEGLIHLRRIDEVQTLIVAKGAPISEKALAELKRDVNRLLIQTRGEAMLGVMCTDQGSDVVINRVARGTAAEKAGLEEGDTIVKYDGQEIVKFERLIDITANHSAGDKIAIEVIRDGKPMKLEAVLTEWQ